MQHHIRLIQPFELDALVRIYNQAVEAGLTADTTPVDIAAKRDWFQEHSARQYPIYVAESVGQVIGWSSLSLYRGGRSGVKKTAEISYYIDFAYHRKGMGRALVRHTIAAARERGFAHLIAILLESNSPSINLLESEGFACWGTMPAIVETRAGNIGHLYYGKHLLPG